jgi:hypothetical protein
MGMFDHVLIEGHELPGIAPESPERAHRTEEEGGQEDLAGKPVVFQTKDLENYLGTYVIRDGRLYERVYEYDDVPEEERPYYGKLEWDEGGPVFGKDFYRRSGSRRVVSYRDEDLEYHGDLIFYTTKKDLGLAGEYGTGLVTFRARFTEGDLQWIRPYDRKEAGPEIREWRTRRRRRR